MHKYIRYELYQDKDVILDVVYRLVEELEKDYNKSRNLNEKWKTGGLRERWGRLSIA